MKRLTVILLLSLHIMAFTECRQLLRIPYLLQHFQQHRTADPVMNLAVFLKIHYLSPLAITDDFKQDMQLPFRNVDCHLVNATVYLDEPIGFSVSPPASISLRFCFYNETNKPQVTAIAIFQPPRQYCLI